MNWESLFAGAIGTVIGSIVVIFAQFYSNRKIQRQNFVLQVFGPDIDQMFKSYDPTQAPIVKKLAFQMSHSEEELVYLECISGHEMAKINEWRIMFELPFIKKSSKSYLSRTVLLGQVKKPTHTPG